MNVGSGDDRPIDPVVWHGREMREALSRRDIGRVYRLLRRVGVSQRQIAACTGQGQSEISAITNGRQVQAYDVLERIADGLKIPRGYLGLAYSDDAVARALSSGSHGAEDGFMERRGFLGLVSKLVVGSALTPAELDFLAVTPASTPVPEHVGTTDVEQVRTVSAKLRALDVAHGGGSCRDAILAHVGWAQSLLNARCDDTVRARLLSAVAEIKTLAGWSAHDLGLADEARRYLGQAVRDAQDAGDPAHTAIVLHHLGRVPLDNGDPGEALKVFQLGEIAAKDSRSTVAVAFLHANQAVAYAHQGDQGQALTALRRAEDEYAHAGPHEADRGFTRFFDQVALDTAAARVHSQLGLIDPGHRAEAITRLTRALAGTSVGHGRQRAFNLAWLATCLLAEGDLDTGVELGTQALHAVRAVQSTRLLDHLKPLEDQAARHGGTGDVQQLHHEVRLLRSVA
ncbi:helix-turn-helix domain-containing protein [Saccharothrix obliqua]|uniref:helix-turn-helix domain-containing protein n=1 Tax=Saccharothrix obliqua TaxID=2861747 RepID=UPI001C5F971E|nr:helix-turn-helix transcriptional regulator [Saccharothrix obliqua]MBW4722286.1 helix-turn-helix domain-containing protein [Saccharothrix obliqua]